MGYETRLFVGMFDPEYDRWRPNQYVILTKDLMGNPQGTAMHLHATEEGRYFYLLDGNSAISYDDVKSSVKLVASEKSVYFSVFARFDLSKVGHIPEFLSPEDIVPVTPEIYGDDGNTLLLEDCYGEKLVIYDGQKALEALRQAYEDSDDYWRLRAAVQFLEEALKSGWERIGVVFYGY